MQHWRADFGPTGIFPFCCLSRQYAFLELIFTFPEFQYSWPFFAI